MLLPRTRQELAAHFHFTLDDIARRGRAEAVWDLVGTVLCWHRVAERLGVGIPEMQVVHDLAMSVLQRYAATGRTIFTGPEYTAARDGVIAMEQLAELVDHHTAVAAADWAEERLNALHAIHRQHAEA